MCIDAEQLKAVTHIITVLCRWLTKMGGGMAHVGPAVLDLAPSTIIPYFRVGFDIVSSKAQVAYGTTWN